MKLTVLVSLLMLTGSDASPQGIFGGLGNFLGGLFGRPRRPAVGQPRPAVGPGPSLPSGGGGGGACPNSEPNHSIGNQQFLISWRLGAGCTSFTAAAGASYCARNGMRLVSLDTPAKESELSNLLLREGQPYFWTGGRVNFARRTVRWPSGSTTSNHNWSPGQPNNSERPEDCLAVIVKGLPGFNDVNCRHTKPVICQQ